MAKQEHCCHRRSPNARHGCDTPRDARALGYVCSHVSHLKSLIATMQDPFKRVLSLLDHLMGQDEVQTTRKLACTRCSAPLALALSSEEQHEKKYIIISAHNNNNNINLVH
jgi:hypothetical protein